MGGDVKGVRPKASGERLALQVQVIAAILMLVVGVLLTAYVPFFPDKTPTAAKVVAGGFGNLLSLGGGALLSWVIAASVSRRDAREEISEHLEAVSRNLALVYSSIIEATIDGQAGVYDSPETPLRLIAQAANSINGQITEIQAICGDAFEGRILIETKGELDELQRRLHQPELGNGKKAINADDIADIREMVDGLQANINLLAKHSSTRFRDINAFSAEDATCPHCGVVDQVLIGVNAGTTVARQCKSCGLGFNMHRGADGGVFTRPRGTPVAKVGTTHVKSLGMQTSCPRCGRTMTITYDPSISGIEKKIVCARCNVGFVVATPTGEVQGSAFDLTYSVGSIEGNPKGQPYTRCPGCETVIRCALNDRDRERFLAVCWNDNALIGIPYQDVQDWKLQKLATGQV